jgi:hypothetical protein
MIALFEAFWTAFFTVLVRSGPLLTPLVTGIGRAWRAAMTSTIEQAPDAPKSLTDAAAAELKAAEEALKK